MMMKQKILKTLALTALIVVGVSSAWADGKIVYPNSEIHGRLSYASATSTYSHHTAPSTVSSTGYLESTWRKSGFYMLQEWDLSDVDVNRIKSITYTFYTKENTGGMLWIYGSALPSTDITAADLGAAMYTVMGSYPADNDGASAMEAKTWAKGFTRNSVTTDVYKQELTISGSAINTFKENVADNKIVMVLSASAGTTVNFYTFKNDDYKAKMVIEYYPVTVTIGGTTTNYAEINTTLKNTLTDDATVKIYDDVNLTDRIQVAANKTVNVLPQKDGITITNTTAGNISFLSNAEAGTLNVGSDDYAMTVTNGNAESTADVVESNYGTAVVNIKNVTFSGVTTSSQYGIIGNRGGKINLKNVTFSNCTSTYSGIKCIAYCGVNDGIVLEGNNQFTGCTGYDINAVCRFQINETNGVTNTTPIRVYSTIAMGSPVATKVAEGEVAKFALQDTSKGLVKRSGLTRYDLWITEAYTLNLTSAGAATLILPFVSTLPIGVSCYTLAHSDGSSVVTATPVGSSLAKNTPVLVNALEGSYKFVNTQNDKAVTEATTGSGTHTSGALTGVYSETTFGSDEGQISTTDHYILNVVDSELGFYKAVDGKKVGANKAYLTATGVPGDGSARGLTIVFDDVETTGISMVNGSRFMVNGYYDLQGRRVAQPARGLYIVNGKKVVIK